MPDIFTRDELRTEIRVRYGDLNADSAEWTNTQIDFAVNKYMQELPTKLAAVAISQGVVPEDKIPRFEMWKTQITSTASAGAGNFVIAAGTQQGSFPTNFDHPISFWDVTNERPIEYVENVEKWHTSRYVAQPPGVPRAIEPLGFSSVSSVWKKGFLLWPSPISGYTPSIRMTYYRLPADLSGATDTLDIDYKYAQLGIVGPLLELLRTDDPSYERFLEREREMLLQLARTAKST